MSTDLTPVEVAARLHSPDPPLLLDVREDWERALVSIDGSLHIPMGEIPARLHELPADRDVVVYCHHGTRSAAVAAYLRERGLRRVANLHGGIDAWSAQVDANLPTY